MKLRMKTRKILLWEESGRKKAAAESQDHTAG